MALAVKGAMKNPLAIELRILAVVSAILATAAFLIGRRMVLIYNEMLEGEPISDLTHFSVHYGYLIFLACTIASLYFAYQEDKRPVDPEEEPKSIVVATDPIVEFYKVQPATFIICMVLLVSFFTLLYGYSIPLMSITHRLGG